MPSSTVLSAQCRRPSKGNNRASQAVCRALCLQGVSTDVMDDTLDSDTNVVTADPDAAHVESSESGTVAQRSRTKLFDGNWFQKPKKFFKVLK